MFLKFLACTSSIFLLSILIVFLDITQGDPQYSMAGIVIASVISFYYFIAFPLTVVFEASLHAKLRKVKSPFAAKLISYLVLGFIAGYVISFFVGVLPEARIVFILEIDIAMFILFIFEIIFEMFFKKKQVASEK